MVVRTASGSVASYPTVETVHRDNICLLTFAPCGLLIRNDIQRSELAESAVLTFEGAGIFWC